MQPIAMQPVQQQQQQQPLVQREIVYITKPEEGVGDALYSGAAAVGRIAAIINAIMMSIVGLVLVIAGIVCISEKEVYTEPATATLEQRGGNITTNNGTSNIWTVSYQDRQGQTHTTQLLISAYTQQSYSVGQIVFIQYNPTNYSDIRLKSLSNTTIGIILILVALVLVSASWLWVYLTRRSKFAAAAGGVDAALGLFRR